MQRTTLDEPVTTTSAADQRETARRAPASRSVAASGGRAVPASLNTSNSVTTPDSRSTSSSAALDLLDGRPRSRGGRLFQTQPQPRKWRAQLVRRVGHEVALRVDHPLHAPGHLVEGGADLALLARALHGHAHREVALAGASGSRGQTTERAHDRRGQQRACGQPEQQHDQAHEHQPQRR